MQVLKEMVRELVAGGFKDDALEFFGLDVACGFLIEVVECLSDALAL